MTPSTNPIASTRWSRVIGGHARRGYPKVNASEISEHGRDERPRPVPLDVQGDLQQQLLGEVPADDLQADRQPVERAGRDRHGRVAVQVGRERQPAVVAPPGLDPAERVRQRAVGGEGDVGVARR